MARDFDAIYEEHLDYLFNSLRRLGVSPAHVEDLAHDVLVTAWRKLGEFDQSRPMRPWLFGIAYRLASDHRSKASVQREVGDDDAPDFEDERPNAEAELEASQRRMLVRKAIGAIQLERRAVFIMHELDGAPIPEVAAALEIPLNTAYSRLRLARVDFAAAVVRLREVAP